jgi:hypothetical protein
VIESACAEKADLGKSLVRFAAALLYSSRRVTVAFAYGPEVVADALVHNSGDSFRSWCQPWPYSKPTVSRRNEYGRIRWTWATLQKEYGEKEKLDL